MKQDEQKLPEGPLSEDIPAPSEDIPVRMHSEDIKKISKREAIKKMCSPLTLVSIALNAISMLLSIISETNIIHNNQTGDNSGEIGARSFSGIFFFSKRYCRTIWLQ